MFSWFRRPASRPRSTREMSRVLRAASQFSDDAAEKAEYDSAADALDRVLTLAERHSDAPTRDAFAYALGRAELDLGDKLAELIEVTKDTHITVQDVHTAQGEQGAAVRALRAEFQQFGEDMSNRIGGLERRMDASETDRKEIRDVISAQDVRHGGQINEIAERLKEIERRLELPSAHDGQAAGS